MFNLEKLRSAYNTIAENWHRNYAYITWWIPGADHFIKLLPSAARVLDLGCGSGENSKYLIDHGLRVTGVDFAEQMIEIARREISDGDFRVLDVYRLDQLDEQFDGIFAQAVLLHIPKSDILHILRLMHDRIRPGGYCYVAVKERREGEAEEEIVREEGHELTPDAPYPEPVERFFSYFTADEMQLLMTTAGFTIVYSEKVSSGRRTWLQFIGQK